MQKAPVHPFGLSSSELEDAFERARAYLHTSEAAAAAEEAASTAEDGDAEPLGERLLMGHELLLAIREPIEWLLALTRRLAAGDPDDVAAIDRLTAAFHNRLGCGSHGVTVADAITAFGILIGALDPSVVLAAATKTITDGVASLLTYEGAVFATQLARLAEAMPAAVRRVCMPRASRRRGTRAHHTF
jgi:hypothetical protein